MKKRNSPKSRWTGKVITDKQNEMKKPNSTTYKLQKPNSEPITTQETQKNNKVYDRHTAGRPKLPNCQFIPTPKTPKNPIETLRISLSKLRSSQCSDYVSALQDITQISRFNHQLLTKSLHIIYKGITKLLLTARVTAMRTACQAANELFMNIPSAQSPEFEELVHALLQKTVDPNKDLQKDALEALNSMIIHVPPVQSIKILLHRRISVYGLGVRRVASKLLACVLDESDSSQVSRLNEDLKARLIFAAIRFLQDDCYDIKLYGMRLLTTLLQHKDFEDVMQKKISVEVLQKINVIIENVRTVIRQDRL